MSFELSQLKSRYKRYLLSSLLLTVSGLLLTYVASEIKSLWLMLIAFALILVSFIVMFIGLTLRLRYLLLKESYSETRVG